MEINLGDIAETVFIPLWGRATISREHPTFFSDAKAVEVVEQMDYDIPTQGIEETRRYEQSFLYAARAKQIDDKIRGYLAKHPKASVIALGAGLDTAFYRVDNGTLRWYDLDLPSVMALRSKLLPEPERVTYISGSLFDPDWFTYITNTEDGVIVFAAGVLEYFEASRIRTFFSSLADTFPGAEIVFDAQSGFQKLFVNLGQRRRGMKGSMTKWALKDARTITGWDNRIVVVDQFPMFKNIPREPEFPMTTKRMMDLVDKRRMQTIVHLRV